MRNYINKKVFLGMDIHKKTYAVTAICDGQVIKRDTLRADPSILINYCKKYFPGSEIYTAYEAGFCGFHLHRCLESSGINNIVVDAAGIEVAVADRVKTDKRDSLKLATNLALGKLKGIFVPSIEQEDRRAITRLRDKFVCERSRLACQMKSLMYQHGLIRADDRRMVSPKWIKEIEAYKLLPGLKFALGHYCNLWLHINEKIAEIDREISIQAQADGLEIIYRSVPGIGPTSARVLANELGNMSQFNNERQLFSYLGLTPSEHSSGEHVRQGHITRQGRPILRKILIQVAWKAIKLDNSLGEIYEQLSKRAGGKRAIVAIARRIAGHIRACFRTGELYCIEEIEMNQVIDFEEETEYELEYKLYKL
jgi:transposase